jgi:hypothetical protein
LQNPEEHEMLVAKYEILSGDLAQEYARKSPLRGARGLRNAADIFNSWKIKDLVQLAGVPRNDFLVKGAIEVHGREILLVDLRVSLMAADPAQTDAATAVIVELGGTEVGLIIDPSCQA